HWHSGDCDGNSRGGEIRLAADLVLLLGAVFSFLGALGLVRMPDIYNRIQAGTKSATLGSIAILLGVALLYPAWWSKLLVIAGFLLFTSPVSSSVLARAVYLSGVQPWQKQGDESREPSALTTGEKS
ncbi:MAG: monovalent cation/H(+) antiporter subunit G, partial [Mariprofundaceae bacterium]|nr:monovalent cation/H(+) antiporter subunit G [Mariprofundaceae bacterium]